MNIHTKICVFEWIRLKKSGVFKSLLLILIILFTAAFYTGIKHQNFRKNTIEYIQSVEKKKHNDFKNIVAKLEKDNEEYKGNRHRDPSNPMGVANHTGNRTFHLPPTDISFIAIGESDTKPNYYKLGLYKKTTLYHTAEIENASVLYNGHFDISFVLVFIIPLLVIALTYNIASFDKEHGTFGILLSSPISFNKIMATRFIFRGILLYAITVFILTTGVFLTGNYKAVGNIYWGLLLLSILAYILFWCVLSYWVNSFQKSSNFNAGFLTSLWLILIILFPGIIKEISAKSHPIPSKIELVTKRRELTDSVRNESNDILNQFLEDHPELVSNSTIDDKIKNSITRYSVEATVNDKMQIFEKQFEKQLKKQEAFIDNYRFISPAIIMQKMVEHISGNGKERYIEFENQFHHFREEYKLFFTKRIFSNPTFKSNEYDLIPKKNYQEKKLDQSSFIRNILFLIGISILFIILSQRQFHKIKK